MLRDDRGGGGGPNGPIGAGGPDVPIGSSDGTPAANRPSERPKLKLAPRSKPAGTAAQGGSNASPAAPTSKKASIFGGGKAHDEFAYEVGEG